MVGVVPRCVPALLAMLVVPTAASAQYYPAQYYAPQSPPAYAQPANPYPSPNGVQRPAYGNNPPTQPPAPPAPGAPQLPPNYASAPAGALNQVARPNQYSIQSLSRQPARPCPTYQGCPDNRSYVGWRYSVPGFLVNFMKDRCQRIDRGSASVSPGAISGSSTVACSFYVGG